MSSDEDDRYRRVLEEFGKFAREFQEYKLAREQALNELERRLVTQIQFYWQAAAAGMRQLSDWSAATEDEARKERKTERRIRRISEVVIVVLLLFIAIEGYMLIRGGR